MAKKARDVMTPDPACCSLHTSIDQVAKMMIQNNCGEIPIVDASNRPLGVVTDRDIVCRIVAEGKNPLGYTAEQAMTTPAVTPSRTCQSTM
jgi:CBS domain-containing protein